MNVTLRQLHVFRSVAATRNFSRAGEQIGLTQPAVSRCITELEAQLGLQLLNRTTREVELTEAGRSLAARLERVLDDLDTVLLDVRGMASERRGRVRVASSPTLSAHLMPDCIARCQRELPGLQIVLLDRIQNDVLASVLSGEVDFGVVIDPGEREALTCEAILTEPFCLACPPAHPLARKRSVRWTNLEGQPLVLLDHASGSRRLIDQAFAAHGVHATVAQEVGHPTTIFRMLTAGLGISVVPTLALPPEGLHGVAVRPLRPQVDREIVLVHRRNRALAPVAQAAWDLVRTVARERQAKR
ncbi:LysR family transcriptional regulator [Paracidovorax valerianellae]|uniref:DNA-binding transcriptional regulator, LysR family n=1 Tax=Paracidovorax valerianellae TaxID=187868 RepID=A0A1G6MS42_9BURK|nr:LysR family transcriptional regulator [Paracidovorax valerianellae]MDA8443945.1 LysR family transcriptional regulator [Paracidovorax valerianellae]SDC58034.1 DNA-binding transcriptional regulator, LysR family [Paracidovorax valerianellae]